MSIPINKTETKFLFLSKANRFRLFTGNENSSLICP